MYTKEDYEEARGYLTSDEFGYYHKEDLPDFDHMQDHVKGIWEALYVDGDLDKLQMCLEEVHGELDMEYKDGKPKLSPVESFGLMNTFIGYKEETNEKRG